MLETEAEADADVEADAMAKGKLDGEGISSEEGRNTYHVAIVV